MYLIYYNIVALRSRGCVKFFLVKDSVSFILNDQTMGADGVATQGAKVSAAKASTTNVLISVSRNIPFSAPDEYKIDNNSKICANDSNFKKTLLGSHVTVMSYERHSVSNHPQLDGLSNSFFVLKPKKLSRPRIIGPLWRESTGDRWITLLRTSNVDLAFLCHGVITMAIPTPVTLTHR